MYPEEVAWWDAGYLYFQCLTATLRDMSALHSACECKRPVCITVALHCTWASFHNGRYTQEPFLIMEIANLDRTLLVVHISVPCLGWWGVWGIQASRVLNVECGVNRLSQHWMPSLPKGRARYLKNKGNHWRCSECMNWTSWDCQPYVAVFTAGKWWCLLVNGCQLWIGAEDIIWNQH